MSDAEKTDMPSDTQDTFFEESESNSQLANNTVNTSNCMAESQDFHLLDTGDSQELDLPINDSEVVSKENDNTEKIMENENSVSKEESIMEQTEEDEDIVHGTPPPCFSPSKKLSALADKSLKRRADFSEDSCENLPQIKRNKIDDDLQRELELMESDTSDIKTAEQKCDESLIIPETQESTQDCSEKNLETGMENSLEEECDLVNEAIDSVNDGDENQNDSTVANFANNDVSNQNENSLLKDLNESKEIDFSDNFTENGDEKKDFNKTVDDTNIENELSKIVEISDDTTNNIERTTTSEENDAKCETELEKANSIEDALKQLGGECDSTSSSKPIIEKESTESELLAVLTDSDTNAEVDEVSESKLPTSMETDEKSETTEKKPNEQNEQLVKSRMSIEVIYDRSSLSQEIKPRPSEIVEIDDDDDDDKIVIDSSQDESKIPEIKDDVVDKKNEDKNSELNDNKSIVKDNLKEEKITLINGGDIDGDDLDTTASLKSDSDTKEKVPKVFLVSDSENDSMLENKSTSESHVTLTAPTKTQQIEKEFTISVRLKCLITIDESTKDVLNKELLTVNCEINNDQIRHSDTSTSLADISGNDNKDGSPGSVTSATYPRFSIMSTSTISSSTSSSSSGSLATKLTNDKLFSIPKGKAKHTKKLLIDGKSSLDLDQLGKEWKNSHLLSTSILNFLSTDVNILELQNGVDAIDETLKKIRSSTPEASEETPQRSLKKGRPPKRLQTRTTRKRTKIIATTKTSPNVIEPITEDSDEPFSMKENKKAGFSTPVKKSLEGLRNSSFAVDQPDELLGKQVFAKWSDNNYYAGHVMDKNKSKYKVNFLDGKSKQLIAEFIIPISETFGNGLSVYTLTKDGDYGPCGMIVDILETNNKVSYVIEPDEGKKITVQIKDIFLTPDQAQVLKEELWSDQKSLPSTPHSITQVNYSLIQKHNFFSLS